MKCSVGLLLLLFLCLQWGCASRSNSYALQRMEQQAGVGRQYFHAGEYERAEEVFVSLCSTQSVSQPLYQCELASTYLVQGKKELAYSALFSAHQSIEGFFDAQAEKRAASLWGSEASKVYKGEPYERSVLYLLLAFSMLERGDVDNALAALKSGMLADSDMENESYNADFGLLQLMAAKCYSLRNEPDLRDQMLREAFASFTAVSDVASLYADQLVGEYERNAAVNLLHNPPSRLLQIVCALGSLEAVEQWLRQEGVEERRSKLVAAWAHNASAQMDVLDFNALIVVWRGSPPTMQRQGRYGEKRVIVEGYLENDSAFSLLLEKQDLDPFGGFGNVNFQATTRGGRVMDNVLSAQSSVKGALDDTGNVLLSAAASTDDAYAAAFLGLVGVVAEGLSSGINSQADVRHWGNLPYSFDVALLTLDPGVHDVAVQEWMGALPLEHQSYRMTIDDQVPLAVLHVLPEAKEPFDDPGQAGMRRALFAYGAANPALVDVNQDGEICFKEYNNALSIIVKQVDSDGDGELSEYELDHVISSFNNQYVQKMVVE